MIQETLRYFGEWHITVQRYHPRTRGFAGRLRRSGHVPGSKLAPKLCHEDWRAPRAQWAYHWLWWVLYQPYSMQLRPRSSCGQKPERIVPFCSWWISAPNNKRKQTKGETKIPRLNCTQNNHSNNQKSSSFTTETQWGGRRIWNQGHRMLRARIWTATPCPFPKLPQSINKAHHTSVL